jgi:hypothetical protein
LSTAPRLADQSLPGRVPRAISRPLLLAAAAAVGVAAGWAAGGRIAVLAVTAVGLAAANGYAKAYSP